MDNKTYQQGLGFFIGLMALGAYGLWSEKAQADTIQINTQQINRVYDGDTFYITLPDLPPVFGRNIGVRITGIDTPEMHSRCKDTPSRLLEKKLAASAKESLTLKLHNAKVIELTALKRDKYFRLLATVLLDGKDAGKQMIAEGLALPYDGGKKKGWCANGS